MIIHSSKNIKSDSKLKKELIIPQVKKLEKTEKNQFSVIEKNLNETVLEDNIVEIQDNRIESEKPIEEDENLNQWLEGTLED